MDFKKRKESFSYHFRNDLVAISNDFNNRGLSFDDGFLCSGGQHPRLLRLLIQRRASFQTIIVLDQVLSFIKNWNKQIEEKVVWPKIAKTIERMKPFINYNITECKLIMKEVIKNSLNKKSLEKILLHSQTQVKHFYKKLGFEPEGKEFFEDNIPHIKMIYNFKTL